MKDNNSLKMQYKTFWGSTEVVVPKLNTYLENNNLYVGLNFFEEEYECWEPFTDVTVNVGKLPFLESAIDTNNNGNGIIDFLVQNGFGELTKKTIPSGFCVFPVFRFNEEKLREIDNEMFEQYASLVGPRKDIESQISKDKIMVAMLDTEYYAEHHEYPEEYSSEYAREVYTFDTPEEFVQKWHELQEGDWYWVFDKGEIVCSGALDPGDVEIFEEYWGRSFELSDDALDLPLSVTISAKELAADTDDVYKDEDVLSEMVSDYLSDTFGFCHGGFAMNVVYNEFGEPSEVVATDIKWDTDDNKRISLAEKISAAKKEVAENFDNNPTIVEDVER